MASLAISLLIFAQPGFDYGDVVVTAVETQPDESRISRLLIYGRDGSLKRELIRRPTFWTEPLYRNGIVYVASRFSTIDRIDDGGNVLAPFASWVPWVNFLSPGPEGGILAVNGSGEIYQFDTEGALVYMRNFLQYPLAQGGIELASDGCTVYYASAGSLARWDACLHTPPAYFGPNLAGGSRGLRVLSDGTFLEAVTGLFPDLSVNCVIHVDAGGNLIRSYPIPGYALALDTDGRSFWTDSGATLFRIDIESGEILAATFVGSRIFGISVVGEPRPGLLGAASIPVTSPELLGVLSLALAVVALVRLREF